MTKNRKIFRIFPIDSTTLPYTTLPPPPTTTTTTTTTLMPKPTTTTTTTPYPCDELLDSMISIQAAIVIIKQENLVLLKDQEFYEIQKRSYGNAIAREQFAINFWNIKLISYTENYQTSMCYVVTAPACITFSLVIKAAQKDFDTAKANKENYETQYKDIIIRYNKCNEDINKNKNLIRKSLEELSNLEIAFFNNCRNRTLSMSLFKECNALLEKINYSKKMYISESSQLNELYYGDQSIKNKTFKTKSLKSNIKFLNSQILYINDHYSEVENDEKIKNLIDYLLRKYNKDLNNANSELEKNKKDIFNLRNQIKVINKSIKKHKNNIKKYLKSFYLKKCNKKLKGI